MKGKMRSKLRIIIVCSVVLVAGMGVASLAWKKPKLIPAEKIVTVERGDVARSVVARGKIEPLSKVEVKSKANGIIKALMVDVGDTVRDRKGTRLNSSH